MRQAICVLCFDHLGFEEVTSGAFTDNPASRAVSRKVGYRENGEHRFARQGALATMVGLVLRPEDLVRPPYDVVVEGAQRVRRARSGARDVEPVVLVALLQANGVRLGLDRAEHAAQRRRSSSGASSADHTTSAPPGRRARRASASAGAS